MAQDAAMLVIACSCGQKMKVPAQALGKTATCVKCGERLRITAETADPSNIALGPSQPTGSKETPERDDDPVRMLRMHGLITERAIEEVLLLQQDFPHSMWDLLVDLGHVSSEDFHTAMSRQKGIAGIDLSNYHIPNDVLELVPPEMAYRGMSVPVDRLGKLLTLAMACPLDAETIAEIEDHTGLRVKRMLSSIVDIRRMLETAYPQYTKSTYQGESGQDTVYDEFESVLQSSEVARRVLAVESLPSYANTIEEIDAVLDVGNDQGALRAITDLVALDPVATAMVLRVANSEAYGFSQRVDGLGLACTLLGPRAIASVVNSVEPRSHRGTKDGFDYSRFLDRAQFCAEAAQGLAMRADEQSAVTAYTAGLLHDVGRLVLAEAAPRSYPAITRDLLGANRFETEQRIFHLDSAEAGYMFARMWGLPMSIAEPIRYHRSPGRARYARELTGIVSLAAELADAFEGGTAPSLDSVETLFTSLEITRAEVIAVFQDTQANLATDRIHA